MSRSANALGPRQSRLLCRLGPILTEKGFYLGGGTALALGLGHRRSADLDWFTRNRLTAPQRLAADLNDAGIPFKVRQVEPGTLLGRVGSVRVSFFEYRYPLIEPCVRSREFQCEIASMADLAAMKLSAIAQRGAKKDFVDVYALGLKVAPLSQMLAWYQQKYRVKDIAHVLYSLAYFSDADQERIPPLLWRTNWRLIKQTLREWLLELSRGSRPR